MITKVSKIFSVQRVNHMSTGLLELFMVLYLLHKRMPNSNKCIQLGTKSGIKAKKLANRRKKIKKKLKCYWNRTHIF